MDYLDIFYRAFKSYKEITALEASTSRVHKYFEDKNEKENQNLSVFIATCTVEEDWVERIEYGIDYIAKAIKEERQFIRNDGEVLPIEKVRKTSKASIEDLAKHSNYITHEPMEGAASDVVPDKLLVVQREHDFAVYENRVVYSLLMYLKDFINSRLTEIREVTNTYDSSSHIHQNVDLGNEQIHVDFNFKNSRKNDPYLVNSNACRDIIARMDDLLTKVLILLKTPLMIEVSKVDMITLPIVKTNVLKMNHNFRECVSLYEFLLAYDKPGYTVTREEKSFAPYALEMVNDYVEVVLLYSFISYMRANSLEEYLEKNYQLEEERRRRLLEEETIERANKIRLKSGDTELTASEYIVMMSEANRILQEKVASLSKALEQKDKEHQEALNAKDKEHALAIDNLKLAHDIEKQSIRQEHDLEMQKAHENFITQLQEHDEKHREELDDIRQSNREEYNQMVERYSNEISDINSKYTSEIKELNEEHKNESDDLKNQIKQLKAENKELRSRGDELESRLQAFLVEGNSLNPQDYLSEVDFNLLEKQKRDFDEFYKKAWKEAKKAIRQNNIKIEKKKKNKEETPEASILVEEEKPVEEEVNKEVEEKDEVEGGSNNG